MTYHKIRSLELTGGFLQGVRLDFDDSLNCIIGGRGTGKTTVLEALRYVLDQMPDPNTEKDRHRSIERLLQSNLGAGSARAEIETVDGTSYTVVRGFGESPLVTNEQGDPVDINIGKNIVFGVDVYSQNEIEDIANDPLFQLRLIDKFIHTQVAELEREIRDTTRSLDTNATTILETRRMVDDLAEATRELPDVAEKIRGFEKADGGGGDLLRKEHEQKSLRARELQLVEGVRSLYGDGIDGIKAVAESLRRRFDDVFDLQLDGTPNRALVEKIRDSVLTAVETAERQLESAKDALGAAQGDLKPLQAGLAERQAVQEKQYRELIDKHEQERAKGVERTRLEQRHTDLKAKEKKLNEKKVALRNLNDQRAQLRARLSDLRDDRYHLRLDVAQRLNEHLSPMIRVRVEQFGNMEDYRDLLTQS
ncbi:MAG: AAA family ATPase, partial [Longimicrobiales bacterium]